LSEQEWYQRQANRKQQGGDSIHDLSPVNEVDNVFSGCVAVY
jgi:hypothetical protein